MTLVWFICGLGIGLAIWVGSVYRHNLRLTSILKSVPGKSTNSALTPFSRLERLISQLQQEQQDLLGQLHKWQGILCDAPIAYLEVDGDDYLVWYNSSAVQLLDIGSHRSAINTNRLLLEVVRSYELDQLIKQVRQSQRGFQQDWIIRSLPSEQPPRPPNLPLRGYGLPLPGNHVGVFLENRQEAKTLEAERDRWTSDVAHELKTPLTSIRLMAETLQDQADPQLHSWTKRLLKESMRLSRLVQDLLELGQVHNRQFRSRQFNSVDLPALVRSAWLNLEPLAQPKNLSLFYQGPDHLILQADETRLYRVLINLIDNAIQYSPIDHPIQIHLALKPYSQAPDVDANPPPKDGHRWVCIDVIDHGPGFPSEALPHVFKRFYRAELSRSRSQLPLTTGQTATEGGSGLGLAIVEQIVTAHGGNVEARNHPVTHGAWIQILLPQRYE